MTTPGVCRCPPAPTAAASAGPTLRVLGVQTSRRAHIWNRFPSFAQIIHCVSRRSTSSTRTIRRSPRGPARRWPCPCRACRELAAPDPARLAIATRRPRPSGALLRTSRRPRPAVARVAIIPQVGSTISGPLTAIRSPVRHRSVSRTPPRAHSAPRPSAGAPLGSFVEHRRSLGSRRSMARTRDLD